MSRPPSYEVAEQLGEIYRAMAEQARYRPGAPSDGFGNITGRLNMRAECEDYARSWWAEEDSLKFHIGCANFPTRPATVYAIEAARALCGGQNDELALKLLEMAADSLRERMGATRMNGP